VHRLSTMRKVMFVIAFCSASTCFGMTLSDIETAIRLNVNDNPSDSTLRVYSDTYLDGFINDGQKDVVNMTWCVETSTTNVLTAQTTFYALPTDYIAAKLVTFKEPGSSTVQLEEWSEKKVYDKEPDFEQNAIGPPSHYFIRFPTDGSSSLEISYLPVPTSSSTGTARVAYYSYPAALSSDSDVPFDGMTHLIPYHMVLVAYGTARIKDIEGKFDESEKFWGMFDRYIAIMNDRLGRVPNYRPSVQGAGR